MATLSYPGWLSLWYRLGPVLRPANRIVKHLGLKPAGRRFRVLLFHDIPDQRMPAFERLVQHLLDRHRIICPEEVESFLTAEEPSQKNGRIPFLLTFDDGFESQAAAAEQVLDRLGVKGVFFICPGLIERSDSGYRETIAESVFEAMVPGSSLPSEMVLMSWDTVRQLGTAGHTIGSHALTHKRLSRLDKTGCEREVDLSSDIVKEQVGTSPPWFAYPFGDVASIDRKSLKLIADRYDFCCTGIPGDNGRDTHPLGILRYNIDLDLSFQYQLFLLEGGMDRLYRSSVRRYRSMLPTQYFH